MCIQHESSNYPDQKIRTKNQELQLDIIREMVVIFHAPRMTECKSTCTFLQEMHFDVLIGNVNCSRKIVIKFTNLCFYNNETVKKNDSQFNILEGSDTHTHTHTHIQRQNLNFWLIYWLISTKYVGKSYI